MLGRASFSPWLITAALVALPALSQTAQDPIAEAAQEVTATQTQPLEVAAAVPAETGGESETAASAETATTDAESTPAATNVGADAPEADGAADPFGPEADDTAPAGDMDGTTSDDAAGDPFAAQEESSGLEDEYGFDPADEFASEEEPAQRDPWEGFNRAIFRFNDTADRWVLKPVAVSYRQVTPLFMQTGVSNFFSNLREIPNTLNSVLQWKWGRAGNDAGRFLVNSTIGLVGLFDVAQHMGLDPNDGEDFGQTLAVWGVPSGPYLVVPLLGPSTMRDGPAQVVDWYTNPVTYVDHELTSYSLKVTNTVQKRANLLKAESLLTGDRYVLLRDAYLQRREYLINDGELEDDFGGDLDDEFGGGDAFGEEGDF